ncbi:Protein RPN4 [Pseudozyma hubeiensis]|nr:Protein RPN4 [Pseudozyma hubeiensis]
MTGPQKDFILFDEPTPPVPRDQPFSPPSSGSDAPIIGSFSKHRSPRQSPNFNDVTTPHQDTLDDAGAPRRKRQKSEVYATSSSYSRSSREGSSGQASNDRITPPDPPSGSLGAPMHDLSLGDSMPSAKYEPESAASALASPATAAMTREQQERVKAQIRAELAGVDTRAFKGPLRDILQKHDYTPRPSDMQTSPLSASSDPMQAGVAPSFSLFPDYEVAGQSQAQPGRPIKREAQDPADQNEEMPPVAQRPVELRKRSSTFEGGFGPMSYPPARHSQNYLPDWARQSQSSQASRDSQSQQFRTSQHSPQSQHSQTSPHQQRPHMPPPIMSQSQLAQRGGPVSMSSADPVGAPVSGYSPGPRRALKRESSGLTVSPQEAFLDYDDVENALSHSGLGKMPSLFATVPPGLSDSKSGSSLYSGSQSGSNTPRMTSQQNVPRARSSTGEPSYAVRPAPMSRNDTARPHHYQNQKRPGPTAQQPTGGRSPYPGHSDGRGSVSQESGSQSSLFSPVDSGDTISTDDDEDERPYYPPNMRPSMIRGGPSSLYLNYPTKSDGRVPASPSAMPPRPLMGKERTSSAGSGAWSHVRNEPWAFRQAHMQHPRFSDVSASSSDSEDDRNGRRGAYGQRQEAEYHSRQAYPSHHHHHQGSGAHMHPYHSQSPHSRYAQPGPRPPHRPSLGGHQSSSESVDDTDDRHGRPSYPSSRMDDRYLPPPRINMPGALGGYGYIPGSQESGLSVNAGTAAAGAGSSPDEDSLSPSIRSSAQASDPRGKGAAEIGAPPPLLTSRQPGPAAKVQKPSAAASTPSSGDSLPIKDDRVEASGAEEEDETGTNSVTGDGDESDYEGSPESTSANASKKAAARSAPKASKPRTSTDNTAKPSATVAADGTTQCDYVSPITGIACQTAFHRPYDLARHRETIHAREEAGFMREGKLKLEDCVVLGKEVDPKKSTAVVEWKCKTCGANFSRKDAMLRHERLRHNAAK